MKTALILAIAALALGVAMARCPNGCSGHGLCQRYDKCACWGNWQGNDCSLRTCAYDNAWALNAADPHFYAECSNKGVCDRATGLCDCFDQYEGRACTRSSCPNNCNGHGKCRYVNDLSAATAYTGWDAEKIQACVCDGGFYGPDCSQRYCPYGDDVMTVCDANNYEVQTLAITYDQTDNDYIAAGDATGVDAAGANGAVVLEFVDDYGEHWFTPRIEMDLTDGAEATTAAAATAVAIASGLTALPNFAIPSVTVAKSVADLYQQAWTITFDDARNAGDQELLICHIEGCNVAGCQPKYQQIRVDIGFYITGAVASVQGDVTLHADTLLPYVAAPAVTNANYVLFVQVISKTTADTGAADYEATHIENTPSNGDQFRAALLTGAEITALDAGTGIDADAGDGTYASFDATEAGEIATHLDGADAWDVPTQRIPVDVSTPFEVWDGETHTGAYIKFAERRIGDGFWLWRILVPECTVSTTTAPSANVESGECSNRGECDTETGLCTCHEGYHGDNCDAQTILV